MTDTVKLEIPGQWIADLDLDQDTVIQEVIRLGLYQLRVRRALELYQAGGGSLGYVAEKMGLSKRELIREAKSRGLEPPFDEQTVDEELG
jgi:hypothetical protein